MADWILIASLKQLFAEFDAIAPHRGHASDGSVGDTAHAAGGTSDHLPDEDFPALRNKDADHIDEVHAIDVTTELNEPGITMEDCVQHILARCRSGAERRLRYIIFNRRIWEADNGWRQRVYTGTADPHTGHAHFSASYVTAYESSTTSWTLEELVMPSAEDIAAAILDAPIGDTAWPGRTVRQVLQDVAAKRDGELAGSAAKGHTPHTIPANTPLGKLLATPALVEALTAKVEALTPPAAQ